MSIKGRMLKQSRKGAKARLLGDGQGARKKKPFGSHRHVSVRHRRSFGNLRIGAVHAGARV